MYISKLDSNYCPVTALRRYIQAADIDLSSQSVALVQAINEEEIRVCP